MIPARRFATALVAPCAVLAACSGSVGPSPVVTDPLAITIQPGTATLYSGIPTDFLITGGTGSYVVTSDNQAAVPIASFAVGHTLTVVPNPVAADTVVTLSVRDTGTTPQKTATLTVKPGTVANSITVTPVATTCNPALCSGQEALVDAVLSQGGIPFGARGARFDVISGDVRFITTPAGTSPERLELSTIAITDQTGHVRARIRATPLAPNQNALIQVTDVESGAFSRVVVQIAQFNGSTPPFFTLPSSITFTGPFVNTCAQSGQVAVIVIGGTPPYTISSSSTAFRIPTPVVLASGQTFAVQLNGNAQCVTDSPVAVTDASGRTIIVTVSSRPGTAAPPMTVNPTIFTLTCTPPGNTTTLFVSGGTVPFGANSSHPRVTAVPGGRNVTVTRLTGDVLGDVWPTTVAIVVNDGSTGFTVTGTITAANCP